ncbi:MAG: hypothetical protein IPL79_05300 [Myxococcales bacterium]|nr:hypothetical protein [Myxococcales bacterium]
MLLVASQARAAPTVFFTDKPEPEAPDCDESRDDDGDGGGDQRDDDCPEAPAKTLWQGSLTLSTFIHSEVSTQGPPISGAATGLNPASPYQRVFAEARLQLDGRHLGGGAWDTRIDVRLRTARDGLQSGSFGGNEYDARELYAVRGGRRADIFVGRVLVPDIGGLKIDGLRVDYGVSAKWTALAFAGLYPRKGSRSVSDDYPGVYPIALGGGAAYRTSSAYGALGAGGVLPMGTDEATGSTEKPRVFLSSNGFYRGGKNLVIYHYGIVDVAGAGGFALTNGSVGLNYRPTPKYTLTAAIHRMNTETLNVHAQAQLEDAAPLAGVIQNNIEVSRIASTALRGGASASLGKDDRFEVSTSAGLRTRPLITQTAEGVTATITANQEAELFVQFLDRRLFGTRVSLSFMRAFGLDNGNAPQTDSQAIRLLASRDFASEKGQWEAELGQVTANDNNAGVTCDPTDFPTCYGSAGASTLGATGRVYYRFKRDWFVLGSLELARERLDVANGGTVLRQPGMTLVTAFARLAYRF